MYRCKRKVIMAQVSTITYNVRGLCDYNKRRAIFHYLHLKKFNIMFLQETHSTVSNSTLWKSQWGVKMWMSHGTTQSRGVAILVNKIDIIVHNVIRDTNGRYLILYVTLVGVKTILCNIYAPNIDTPDFFKAVFTEIEKFPFEHVIVAGDFNLALDPTVDRQGANVCSSNTRSAKWLNEHCAAAKYVDVWRERHPDVHGYTWRRLTPSPSFSRLDYFLINEEVMQFVEEINILAGFRTDHSIVKTVFCFSPFHRGPGYWKFNTSLLTDADYINKINKIIDIHLEDENIQTCKERWELLKLAIRGTTLQYSAYKQKSKRNLMDVLERKIKYIEDSQHLQSISMFTESESHMRLLKHDLKVLLDEKTRGAILRSRCNWTEYGEKPTKYFLNLEKRNFKSKTIYRLKNEQDLYVTDEKEVLRELQHYYAKLYTARTYIDLSYVDKLEIPQISEATKIKLEQPFSLQELSLAVKSMKNNKTPGTDGLPIDFYKVFWGRLKTFLLDLYSEIVEDGEFHLSGKRSVLSLLEKTGRDPLYIKNWRPLSLLNSDNKIYGKMLANRQQVAMEEIIHSSQTGFMKGRLLAENILKLQEILQKCQDEDLPGLIISYDFLKAFDQIE